MSTDKTNKRRDNRSSAAFDTHHAARGSRAVRQRRGWRFMHADAFFSDPHYRMTPGMASLPGKHVRSVHETVQQPHGK